MQFYSLHHCVLLFLILTFTTAPVSALEVCPTRGKLHQPVKLSCTHRCPGLLQWNLLSDRDVVLAQCGQTSCWSEPGFNISHDQYLRGDLSLTITAADYSQRKVYACECEDSDFAYVRLVIETVLSPVQMEFHEDLKLYVSVPEPVEVIYKSSGSADEVICRVNNLSLQCKDEYRDRTSLTYPEITLRHVEPRDSGSYTIRDTENEQDIQIYAVSVEDKPLWELYGVPLWGIVLIVLICCCAAVGMYLLWKHLMRKQLDRRLLGVVQFVQQVEEGKQKISEAEEKMDDLEKSYMGTGYLGKVRKFCAMKRRQLNWYSLQHDEHRDTEKRELNSRLVLVDQLVQRYKGGTEEEINQVEWKINQLEQLYMYTQYYKQVKVLCDVKRKQLGRGGPQHVAMTADTLLKKKMNDVEQCVHEAIEGGKEKMSEAEEKIYQLELHMTSEDVVEVSKFCMYMRAELFWSTLHSDKDQLMTDNIEILWKVEEVMNSLQKIRDEVKREQEILNSTEVDKMKKDLTEIVKWCEEKRRG